MRCFCLLGAIILSYRSQSVPKSVPHTAFCESTSVGVKCRIMLQMQLFGAPRFSQADKVFKIGRRKSLALLAYTAVTGQPHARDVLATLFWPESDQATARMNLRRDLSWLRQKLPDDVLLIERSQVAFNAASAVQVDVHQFAAKLAAIQAHTHTADDLCAYCAHVLMEGVELYRG
jgi:two-component SAPR family response regulator